MSRWRELASRTTAFVRMSSRHSRTDVDDELQFHLQMTEQDLLRRGMTPSEARRVARVRLGGVSQVAEAYADQRTLPWLESLLQDTRFALRMLVRSPGFTAAALITLALGIGATTALFAIVNAVLLRPLPYAEPDRLVVLGDRQPDGGVGNVGYTTFHDIREQSNAFDALAVVRAWSPTLVGDGEAERVPGMRVSAGFFTMLGVRPQLGRSFLETDDRPDRRRVVILSDGLWRRRFGADPGVVGRVVTMGGTGFEVVGVMAADFEPVISRHFYQPAQIWAPVGYDVSEPSACRSCQHLKAIGRIKTGVTRDQALADLGAIRARLERAYPADYPPGEMNAVPLASVITAQVRTPLLVLFGAVGFVMLIAGANVANLALARAVDRSRELAVRAALGAGRMRLIRQLLTEGSLLGLTGGALGLAVATMMIRGVAAMAPASIVQLEHAAIGGRVLAFTLAVSSVTGLALGLIPALRGTSWRLREALAHDRRTGTGQTRARHALVIADLSLALVLLAGAGVMSKSVKALIAADPGFSASGVVTAQFPLVGDAYAADPAVLAFQERLLEKARSLPGVEVAALAGQVPMGKNHDAWGFHIEGLMHSNASEDPTMQRYSVTPDYFRALRIPVRRGRAIDEGDVSGALPVIVISESAAQLWAGADPLGRRVRIGGPSSPWHTVVGIVGDVRHASLDERVSTAMYLPQAQVTDSFLVLTVRVDAAGQEGIQQAIRAILKELDPAVPLHDLARLDDLLSGSFADRRFVTQLLGAFSLLALLLAAIGLYGVVSYAVSTRTREVGLRVALGARRADVLRLVFGSGLVTIAAGLGVGLCAAFLLTRVLASMLYTVSPNDPSAIAAAVIILTAVALLAHWLPARRALRVDPAVALRQE